MFYYRYQFMQMQDGGGNCQWLQRWWYMMKTSPLQDFNAPWSVDGGHGSQADEQVCWNFLHMFYASSVPNSHLPMPCPCPTWQAEELQQISSMEQSIMSHELLRTFPWTNIASWIRIQKHCSPMSTNPESSHSVNLRHTQLCIWVLKQICPPCYNTLLHFDYFVQITTHNIISSSI